jgi:hypothetical protein
VNGKASLKCRERIAQVFFGADNSGYVSRRNFNGAQMAFFHGLDGFRGTPMFPLELFGSEKS